MGFASSNVLHTFCRHLPCTHWQTHNQSTYVSLVCRSAVQVKLYGSFLSLEKGVNYHLYQILKASNVAYLVSMLLTVLILNFVEYFKVKKFPWASWNLDECKHKFRSFGNESVLCTKYFKSSLVDQKHQICVFFVGFCTNDHEFCFRNLWMLLPLS